MDTQTIPYFESGEIISKGKINAVVDGANKGLTSIQEHQDISGKADKANTYTKSEVDSALAGKAASSHIHTQADVTGLVDALSGKADKATTLAGYGIEDASLSITGKLQIGPRSMNIQPRLSNDINAGANISISNDLKISATVPTQTSQLTNNSGFIDSTTSGHTLTHIWQGTQAEYNAISEKDSSTLYVIK